MKILITGATGFLGTALTDHLKTHHEIIRLVRRNPKPGDILWNSKVSLPEVDAVINLAGEPVVGGRWNEEKKAAILNSRVQFTTDLLRSLDSSVKLISASAIGYYGDRSDEVLNETSKSGHDFLSEVCQKWEAAALTHKNTSIIRIGVVLGASGGALQKMLTPFKLGLGGKLGSGTQWMSWIHIDDIVGGITHLLTSDSGFYNLTSPNPVTNLDFTKALGKALGRPTVFGVPKTALKLALGEAAEVLLASQRVLPKAIQKSGYKFKFETLDKALTDLL